MQTKEFTNLFSFRYKLLIAYDGTAYSGWQVQSNSRSIQRCIQITLEQLLRHPVCLTGSSRTDAGVHANGQTAHFETHRSDLDPNKLRHSLNALLPADIRILEVEKVSLHFHARYSALSKIYHYHVHLDPVIKPPIRLYRHQVPSSLKLHLIHDSLKYLIGTHNFLGFAHQGHKEPVEKQSIRTLFRLDMIPEEGGLRFEFEANGFLYKMVRNITGTLIDIGLMKMPPEKILFILEQKDRRHAGRTAPARALFLHKIHYPNQE